MKDFLTSINLGIGIAPITVSWVSDAVMRKETKCKAGDNTPEGAWDTDTDRILLHNKLKRKPGRARKIFLHEMVHAINDLYHNAEEGD